MRFEVPTQPAGNPPVSDRIVYFVPQPLEPPELRDVRWIRRPAVQILDREVELNETFREVAAFAHAEGFFPVAGDCERKFTRPRDGSVES